jgi:uncharacterized protein involved in exopolysaccharide biosynthesis
VDTGRKASPAAAGDSAGAPVSARRAEGFGGRGETSILDIWQILGEYRFVVLGITLLAGLASLATALMMTPQYRAEVLLAPVSDLDEDAGYMSRIAEFGDLAALTGIRLGRKDRKDESIATLLSRQFTDRFIRERKLTRILFAAVWDNERQRWKARRWGKTAPTSRESFERFDEQVRHIHEDRRTGLVTLAVDWQDPVLAAEWANGLVADVNATLRQQAVDRSSASIAYLQEQLAGTSVVELQQVLHRLIELEMKKIILARVNREYAFKVIDPAVVPEETIRPRTAMMVLLGTTAGLILAVIVVLVLHARRSGSAP